MTGAARGIAVLFALFLACVGGVAVAQDERSNEIEAARAEYAEIRAAIEAREIDDAAAAEERLRSLRDGSRQRLAAVERDLESVEVQLSPLGPAPGEGDPPESDELAAQRGALDRALTELSGEKTRIEANIFEANDLLARLSASRIQTLYERLLTRGASPLAPSVWGPASESAGAVWNGAADYFSAWRERKQAGDGFTPAVGIILGALVISLVLFGPIDRWIAATFAQEIEKLKPTSARRVVVAGLKMIARAAPGLIGGFVIIETLRAQGVIAETGEPVARALWFALVAYLLMSGFLRGLFAPANPSWRIAPVVASRGRIVSRLVIAIVIVFGLKILLSEMFAAAGGADQLIRLIKAAGAVIVGALLYALCRGALWRGALAPAKDDDAAKDDSAAPEGQQSGVEFWRIARRLGRAVAIVIVVAALAGYVALADFIASRFYFLAIFLAFAWFARALLKEFARWLRRRLQARRDKTEDDDETRARDFLFWSDLVINVALLIALTPGLLILLGVPASNVSDLASQALFGFTIGGVRIPSLANFALAIVVFIAIMALTKVVQRAVEKGPFAHSHINPGVQNSLITLIGYAGMIIALFAAVSTIGFDLGNLALIAGALSVGIGFGLQSIVNNFVSGLILLFERPIKVGDWIVTPSGEGIVKRISVRSTEIETWDRASIIIPNSELISSTVTNWTHTNKIGRVIVQVGVSYDSDPEKVKEILLQCAQDHPLVVAYPAPFITWMDFGNSSLDFDLRVYLADISNSLTVRTELRFAIFKAFKEAGIEIPFPQRDVHVKSWPSDHAPLQEKKGDA